MEKHIITTVPNIDRTRKNNMINYSIMMFFRLICLLICFLIPLQWVWLPALAAVFIPIIATVSTTQNTPHINPTTVGNMKNQLPSHADS
jgi:Flp pilus assembly protein TadB